MVHRKSNRYKNHQKICGIKKVDCAKVLGFWINKKLNCIDHMIKTKNKIKKVQRMMYLVGKNDLGKWRRLYIFNQYIMSLLYYGSH